MQNPFKNRDTDWRQPRDDDRWEARDRDRDERSSWSEGDGGRTADRYRSQGQGYDAPQAERSWSQDRNQRDTYGQGYGADYSRSYGDSRSQGQRPDYYGAGDTDRYGRYSGDYGRSASQGDYSRGDYNRRDSYRSSQSDHSQSGYAPGAQIWRQQDSDDGRYGRQADFEPDYVHWRNQQISKFDQDYTAWRSEKRQKFSSDFDNWRQKRVEASDNVKAHAENPTVGDVSNGGLGETKRR